MERFTEIARKRGKKIRLRPALEKMHGKKLWAAANEGTRASSHSMICQCRMCEAHTVGEGILHLEDRTRGGREADEVTLPERIVVFVRRLGRSHPHDHYLRITKISLPCSTTSLPIPSVHPQTIKPESSGISSQMSVLEYENPCLLRSIGLFRLSSV